MAVNLATKYSKQIDSIYTHESFVAGKTSARYELDFSGSRSVRVYNPVTVAPVDYLRNGLNRYGTINEMQDTVQELLMSQDKAFIFSIDKGNNLDQMNTKQAGERLRQEINEQIVPNTDKYALGKYANDAGTVAGTAAGLNKTTVLDAINGAAVAFDNHLIPAVERYLFMGATAVGHVRGASDWISPDALAVRALSKGQVGEIYGFSVVKVPDSFLPAGCHFIAWHKNSVLLPKKIWEAEVIDGGKDISGWICKGRYYFDAFVLGQKAGGVYACVLASARQANPAIALSAGQATLTSPGALSIQYTLDGSDPRYSATAHSYTSPVPVTPSCTVKAVAYGAQGKFTSDVAVSAA